MSSSAGRAKRDREKARQERAAIKREKRQSDDVAVVDDDAESRPPVRRLPQGEVLAQLALLHKKFDDGDMDFDDFEVAKGELMSQLDV